jgi:hypothetical protein
MEIRGNDQQKKTAPHMANHAVSLSLREHRSTDRAAHPPSASHSQSWHKPILYWGREIFKVTIRWMCFKK